MPLGYCQGSSAAEVFNLCVSREYATIDTCTFIRFRSNDDGCKFCARIFINIRRDKDASVSECNLIWILKHFQISLLYLISVERESKSNTHFSILGHTLSAESTAEEDTTRRKGINCQIPETVISIFARKFYSLFIWYFQRNNEKKNYVKHVNTYVRRRFDKQ